jgi:hypothetical protein
VNLIRSNPSSRGARSPRSIGSPFEGRLSLASLIASGRHTAGIFMRLFADEYLSCIASLGRPASTIYATRHRFAPMTRCGFVLKCWRLGASRPRTPRGIARTQVHLLNENDEVRGESTDHLGWWRRQMVLIASANGTGRTSPAGGSSAVPCSRAFGSSRDCRYSCSSSGPDVALLHAPFAGGTTFRPARGPDRRRYGRHRVLLRPYLPRGRLIASGRFWTVSRS